MQTRNLIESAAAILEMCRAQGFKLATAESCTGGLIATCLTEIAGSSDVFERGFITYSNAAKAEMLDVPVAMIAEHGAVSELVARAMAEGALAHGHADIAVSVTGVAGPDGGSQYKPVGLVHLACAREGHPTVHQRCLFGDQGRKTVRELAVKTAFELIESQMGVPTVV